MRAVNLRSAQAHRHVCFNGSPLLSAAELCSSVASPDSTTCKSMILHAETCLLNDSAPSKPANIEQAIWSLQTTNCITRTSKVVRPAQIFQWMYRVSTRSEDCARAAPLFPKQALLLFAQSEAPLLLLALLVERQNHLAKTRNRITSATIPTHYGLQNLFLGEWNRSEFRRCLQTVISRAIAAGQRIVSSATEHRSDVGKELT